MVARKDAGRSSAASGRRRSGFFAGLARNNRPGLVRAAPPVYETRGARPDAGAGGGDGRPARPVRAGADRRSPALDLPDPPRRPLLGRQVALQDQRRLPVLPPRRRPRRGPGRRGGRCRTLLPARATGSASWPAGCGCRRGRRWTGSGRRSPTRRTTSTGSSGAPAFRRRFRELDREAMLTRLPRGYAERPPGRPAGSGYQSFTATRMLTEREIDEPAASRRSLSGTSRRWCRWCAGSTPRSAIVPWSGGC